MDSQSISVNSLPLKILPAYTGAASFEDALQDPRAVRLLWLEILVNDQLDLAPWLDREEVREAYAKACRWYHTYRSLINSVLARSPLPHETGPVDRREYRVFAEVLQFVADHA
jgi:hypothetical protein